MSKRRPKLTPNVLVELERIVNTAPTHMWLSSNKGLLYISKLVAHERSAVGEARRAKKRGDT